jgi:DNA-binding transcriptional ArsR family regulator
MMHRRLKDQLYDQFSRIGKAISRPARLEILDLLSQGENGVPDWGLAGRPVAFREA